MKDNDNDTDAITKQLNKTRSRWFKLAKIQKRKEANAKIISTFYKTIIQSLLLFSSETWVISSRNLEKLQSFHNKCAKQMCGNNIKLDLATNEWYQSKTENFLKKCGSLPIEFYIEQRRKTLNQYIEKRPIFRKCLISKPLQSNPNQLTWWNQTKWIINQQHEWENSHLTWIERTKWQILKSHFEKEDKKCR